MADKYIKKWSTSLLIKKMLIKWQKENKEKKQNKKPKPYFSLTILLRIRKLDNIKYWQRCGENTTLLRCGGSDGSCKHSGEQSCSINT